MVSPIMRRGNVLRIHNHPENGSLRRCFKTTTSPHIELSWRRWQAYFRHVSGCFRLCGRRPCHLLLCQRRRACCWGTESLPFLPSLLSPGDYNAKATYSGDEELRTICIGSGVLHCVLVLGVSIFCLYLIHTAMLKRPGVSCLRLKFSSAKDLVP